MFDGYAKKEEPSESGKFWCLDLGCWILNVREVPDVGAPNISPTLGMGLQIWCMLPALGYQDSCLITLQMHDGTCDGLQDEYICDCFMASKGHGGIAPLSPCSFRPFQCRLVRPSKKKNKRYFRCAYGRSQFQQPYLPL
jgi:hypothetical protein